jgi:acyl phosphate:glycerol-3-phosphate acyltransferase
MLIFVISYIIGAIPTGYLLNRYTTPFASRFADTAPPCSIRVRYAHLIPAATSVVSDLLKGIAAVAIAPFIAELAQSIGLRILLFPLLSQGMILACALFAAALGHVLAVYICGWGGKGGAVILGGFLLIALYPTLIALLAFVSVLAITRTVWHGTLIATLVLPVAVLFYNSDDRVTAILAILLLALSIITHYHDLSRASIHE